MNFKRQLQFCGLLSAPCLRILLKSLFIGDKISGSLLQIPPLKVFNLSVSPESCIIPPSFSLHPLFLLALFFSLVSVLLSHFFSLPSLLSLSLSLSLARIPLHKGPHCIVLIQRQHSFRDMQG